MPKSNPPVPVLEPHPLSNDETAFIKKTVERYYGKDAVIRNFGPDPQILELHIETSNEVGMEFHECIGFIMTRIVRDSIQVCHTQRGRGGRLRGKEKIAYRQGVIIQ